MKEKPSWHKATIEGGRHVEGEPEVQEDLLLEELASEKQFILDSAPENWEEEIDAALLQEYRTDIMKWTNKQIIAFSKKTYIWDDPTYAKALLDVISGKITPPLK